MKLRACPFCGVIPTLHPMEYGGWYGRVEHRRSCYLYKLGPVIAQTLFMNDQPAWNRRAKEKA